MFRSGNLSDVAKREFRLYEYRKKRGEIAFHPCTLESLLDISDYEAIGFPGLIPDQKQFTDPKYELANAKWKYEQSRSNFYHLVRGSIILTLFIIFGPHLLAIFLFLTGRFTYRWIGAGFRAG